MSQQRLEQRIQQLETLLEEYKTTINNLEASLEQKGAENAPSSKRYQERMKEFTTRIEKAEEDKMALQRGISSRSPISAYIYSVH